MIRQRSSGPRQQRGVATLMVAMVILFILTMIVLSSTGVSLFEQRTATNENRQRMADDAARYALNVGGEWFKANISNVPSTELGGWLATNTKRWLPCSGVMDVTTHNAPDLSDGSPHPCMAEPDWNRRAELYFYSYNDSATTDDTVVPFNALVPAAGQLTSVGGTAAYPVTATVRALLCRIDTTVNGGTQPGCRATPDTASQNRIALTLISRVQISGENSAAQAKETWASFNSVASTSTVPLVASGSVDGVGNVEISTNPNGAGYGLPVSIWTAHDADVDKTAGGSAASVGTCQLGDYLNKPYRDHGDPPTPETELKTTCVSDNTACGCPAANSGSVDFLSGHVPGSSPACCENVDILDVDTGHGSPNAIPDIQFFPGEGLDHPDDGSGDATYQANAKSDDSLFEWVFDISYETISTNVGGTGHTLQNCGSTGAENCALYALTSADELNAEQVTCAEMNAIGAEASGLYYVTDSSAGSPCILTGQIGSPSTQAIVVLNDDTTLNNCNFFGMLFVRSDNKDAYFRGVGNAMVFGSVVVEGSTDIAGNLSIIFDPTTTDTPGKKLPESTRLARLPGSWLDNNRGGF
jgi:hypothetical protein